MPRLLTIMGSGETAPTMVKTHRRLMEAVGATASGDAVLLDTRSPLPQLLADKLRSSGAVTFASAAALTIGAATVPVYELYKVGAEPFWAEGLDLLSLVGLHVALIPHYDNAEGGHHDTRFCYLGERRLSLLEADLPEDHWVLGVDEHTALVLDLDARSATVEGNGTVTVRSDGRCEVFETGTVVDIDRLRPGGRHAVAGEPATSSDDRRTAGAAPAAGAPGLLRDAERLTVAFDDAVARRDPEGAVTAVLDLEQALVDWRADTLQSDERDQARAALRRMIVRLGEVATVGARDPRSVIAPYVDAVLGGRLAARAAKHYELADQLRDALVDAGLEVRDTPDGTEWLLRE
jgi:hypothetical protein